MWKLKQIFDGEYGCEERQPGEKEKCLVILANEEGEEKTFEANEDWIAAIEKLSANPLMKIIISKPCLLYTSTKIVSEFPERFVKEPALLHFGLYDRNPSD